MNIAVLTSSRADYSIYLPLLKKLAGDPFFKLQVIAFGTHLSEKFGRTVDAIEKDGFNVSYKINTLPDGDQPVAISESIGKTIVDFSGLWQQLKGKVDLVFCLGDRYEMFAAVSATIPFNIPVAHIHGGETTLGAIDNIYRHSMTHVADWHFTSTENHARRVAELKGENKNICNVGALSLDNLESIELYSAAEFSERFIIPIHHPVLVTFHPETVDYEKNGQYVAELTKALEQLDRQIIITMPNADTMGGLVRQHLLAFAEKRDNVYTVESLGMRGYFSCLALCDFVLGNSSSGIIEAASFGKYVIDIGDRQKGRDAGGNVIHCAINAKAILEQCRKISTLPALDKTNIYGGGGSADKIITLLKTNFKL